MSTAETSFDRAEAACVAFLASILGVEAGDNKDIVRDDWIEPDLVNKYAFSISGGPEQVQNYGCNVPGPAWYGFAQLLGQFEKRTDAIAALGKLQNRFPSVKSGRPGLGVNVNNFDMMEHPEITSQLFLDENNVVSGRIFILRARFRVVYNNRVE